MNHIVRDKQDEAVKRFFLSLPVDDQGSVVELNGLVLNQAKAGWVFLRNNKKT